MPHAVQGLSHELVALIYTILLTAFLFVPYVVHRIFSAGIWGALKTPRPEDQPTAGWALRSRQAHQNAVENLVLFAPLILVIELGALNSALTAYAAVAYFGLRVAHFIVYLLGVPGLRTLTFVGAWSAIIVLALAALGVV